MADGWRRKVGVVRTGEGRHEARGRSLGDYRIEGPHAEEDMARVMDARVCCGCWMPYPDRIGPSTATAIYSAMQPWPRPKHEVLELLTAGRCGFCGTEVSVEMAAFLFAGIEHSREVAPGVIASGEAGGELVTDGGLVLPTMVA
jgi:hypothetical protein